MNIKEDLRCKDIRRVFTHIYPDLDALSSVWFLQRFIIKKQIEVNFVPASWDGADMGPNDVALDINAGGKGIKGKKTFKGHVHSCFKLLVDRYADNETKIILKSLIKFIDRNDAYGGVNKVKDFNKNKNHQITSFIALSLVMKALRAVHNSDEMVLSRMMEIFDGIYKINKNSIESYEDIMKKAIVVGRTVIFPTKVNSYSARGTIFSKGYRAMIYVDGDNIGLLTSGDLRADSPEVLKVIASAGESGEWFAHPAGYLIARGTRKDPRETGSNVDPYRLATAIEATRKRLDGKRSESEKMAKK